MGGNVLEFTRRRRGRGLSWGPVFLLALLLAVPARAEKKQYSYEENPVRLGLGALREGRIVEARAHFQEAIDNDVEVYRARYGMAEVFVHDGNDVEAEALFRQALSEAKSASKGGAFPEAHASLGLLLLRQNRADEARLEITQALREDKSRWEVQFAKAMLAIHDKKFDEAREALKEGKDKKGLKDGEDRYHFGMAHWFFAQGDLAGAEKEGLLAMTVNPSDPDYVSLLADIYSKRGEPGLAIQAYERVLAAPGAAPTAPFFHHLGALYEKINEPNEALRKYTEAVKTDSTYAPALRDMGRLYSIGRVYDKAFQAYGRYLQGNPDDLDALVSFTKAALEIRQFKNAHESAKRAFAMDSTRTDIRLLFARAAAQDKDAKRASELYASIPDSTLLEPVDHVRLAQMDFEAQRWDEAYAHLTTAVAKDTTSVEAYFMLGLVDMRRNLPDEAVTALQKATALAPNFSPAPLNLGIALLQAKRTAEGIAALRQAQTLAPENAQVLLTLAQALGTADSTDAAIAEYRRAIELDNGSARAYRGLGLCQIQKKSYGEAVTSLKQATALDGGNADGWAYLGQAYLGLNDAIHARQAAERCLALSPSHPTGQSVLKISRGAQGAGSAQ